MYRAIMRAFARRESPVVEPPPLRPIICANATTAPVRGAPREDGFSYWLAPTLPEVASARGFQLVVICGKATTYTNGPTRCLCP